jgi:undecaprenyl diphosphate synthase
MQAAQHVAIIMDGNGRHGIKTTGDRVSGHAKGGDVAKEIVLHAKKRGVAFLSLWAFSTANWKRSSREIGVILQKLVEFYREIRWLKEHNVKIVVSSVNKNYHLFSKIDLEAMEQVVRETADNDGITVILQINYDGRSDMAEAVVDIAKLVESGAVRAADVDEAMVMRHMQYGLIGAPDPDIVIRTGGNVRLSNYAMLNIAESELVFFKEFWPDFTPALFDTALAHFGRTDRTFGSVKDN